MLIPVPVRVALALAAVWLHPILPAVRADALEAPPTSPTRVELRQNAQGNWRFHVDGAEFPVRGVGGAEQPGSLEQLKAAGGNCVRTWSLDALSAAGPDGETFIDRAHRLGIMVVPGFWLQHERHGFNYADTNFIARQRAEVLAGVRRYRDHPAVLAWGLGNEMEGPVDREGSVAVFRELEQLTQLVKAEDPFHPVMSVIAFQPAKVKNLLLHCPSLDILGVNTYGGAAGAGRALKAAGWLKPFVVAEFGVHGFWEVPKTPWGASYEPTSHEKALSFYSAHRMVFELNDGQELCLGTFAFLWGWKQEYTPTWFGMFLSTGERLAAVDAMTKAWTGRWPTNRCPRVEALTSEWAGRVAPPGRPASATARVTDPESDDLHYEWVLSSESTDHGVGGEAERPAPTHPELIRQQGAPECLFTTPAEPGPYRLFLTVRDGRGNAATANVPFHVAP